MKGACNLSKPQYKTPVVVAQAQKLLHFFNILWYRPRRNGVHLALFYTDATCTDNVAQKLTTLQKQGTFALLYMEVVLF